MLDEIGSFLIENTLLSISQKKSPVKGEGQFKALSSDYKKKKMSEVGNSIPNLELSGSMLDSLDYKVVGDSIKIGVFGKEAPKADGHNNFSGDSTLPKRRFIPDKGQDYTEQIAKEVDRIIADKKSENIGGKFRGDLEDVTTKAEFFQVIGDFLGLSSRSEITDAIFRNQDLFDVLDEMGMTRFLK